MAILDRNRGKKAYQVTDGCVTHLFIKFMTDVSLQKNMARQFSHYNLKYLAVTKSLIKPLFLCKMNKSFFRKQPDTLLLAVILRSTIAPDILCMFDVTTNYFLF